MVSKLSKVQITKLFTESKESYSNHLNSKLSDKTKRFIDQRIVAKKREINDDIINQKLDDINQVLENHKFETFCQRHEETNVLVIQLVDTENQEVVREVPAEKLLDYTVGMDEMLGLFLDERA